MKSFASRLVLASFTCLVVASVGCGDDSSTSSGSGGGGGTATASSGSVASSGASPTTTGGSTTTGGEGGEGGGTPAAVTSTGVGGAGGDGTGGTGGAGGQAGFECDDLPAGPFEPTLFYDGFAGSEDIAFDGLGHLAGKQGAALVLVDADLNETILVGDDVPDAFGTRFAPDGSLVVALPGEGVVVAVSNEGDASALAEDLNGPNGIHVTNDGTVWVTELPAGRIQTIAPGGDAVPFLGSGDAPAVNGIFVDEDRGIVFFTNYSQGELWRIDVDATEEPTLVASIAGAALDGLTMDVCGNIYAVDQGNDRVFRVRTDADGNALGDEELIAQLASNVANAQFGRGAGFSPTTLYAAGNPGDVYAIDVGVPGAPQAGP